jgi:hypothetical protein
MEIWANTGGVTNSCNPDEQFFNAAYGAVVATSNQGRNAPLIRPDAYLAIITVNGDNEDDNSLVQTPLWYATELLSIKGADHPELFSWSYVNPSGLGGQGGHQPFDQLPARIDAMLTLAGGVAIDTKQNNWEQGVADLWNIALAADNRYPLSGTPDPATILVYLDGPPPGQQMPGQTPGVLVPAAGATGSANWTYDATSNTLNLNQPSLALSSTDTIYVEYTLACR